MARNSLEQVSIIVPFYNVESYIGECLDSLINQSYRNIEILCIDDCSPDNSLEIAKSYADSDPRIKIIRHDENRGLGGARNTGIKNAGSDYLCFVDSDDYVSNHFVKLLYKAISESNSELAICNILFNTDGSITPYYKEYKNDVIQLPESKVNVFKIVSQINPACWNKMYKKDLIIGNKIFQPEHRYYEGVLFWIKSVFYSSRIATISDGLYYYRKRSDSIMTTYSRKHIDDRFEFLKQIDNFVKNDILPSPNADVHKITNDSLYYILNQLFYGKTLLSESTLENKIDLEHYYDQEIINFSLKNNWPALPVAYTLYEENNFLKHRTSKQNAIIKKLKTSLTQS